MSNVRSKKGGSPFRDCCRRSPWGVIRTLQGGCPERVVGLVTGVLVDARVGRGPDVLATPRLCPHRRVVDRELIEERLGVNPRKALDDMQVPRRRAESRRVGEVRRVDHERVALPVTDRITKPAPDLGWDMLLIHPDDAGVVDHLHEDQHVVFGLHDLLQVVIEGPAASADRRWNRTPENSAPRAGAAPDRHTGRARRGRSRATRRCRCSGGRTPRAIAPPLWLRPSVGGVVRLVER